MSGSLSSMIRIVIAVAVAALVGAFVFSMINSQKEVATNSAEQIAQMASAFCECGGDYGALREAFGCGHLQGVAVEAAPGSIDFAVHGDVVDLPGGGGVAFG